MENIQETDFSQRLLRWKRCTNGMWQYLKMKYVKTDESSANLNPAVQFRLSSIDNSLQQMAQTREKLKQRKLVRTVSAAPRMTKSTNTNKKTQHLHVLEKVCKLESRKHDYLHECVAVGVKQAAQRQNNAFKWLEKRTSQSSMNKGCNYSFSDAEVLTPFEAVADFKRKSPAYWIGCCYGVHHETNQLELTIRQTGELNNSKYTNPSCQLQLKISLSLKKNMLEIVVLKPMGDEMKYKSSKVVFNLPESEKASDYRIQFCLNKKERLSKKIYEWEMNLDKCSNKVFRTEWTKILTLS